MFCPVRHTGACFGMLAEPDHASEENTMAKKPELDPEEAALIAWCTQVEEFLVKGGATRAQAQEHIEEEVEWFTDQFYDGLSPEEAAKEALA
jgi:hypothetical protein